MIIKLILSFYNDQKTDLMEMQVMPADEYVVWSECADFRHFRYFDLLDNADESMPVRVWRYKY